MTESNPWWHSGVIYQIYLRSFTDSDGDGIGDFAGLRSRLDYVEALGVDGVWLNPCYPSPQRDHGYDIADYFDIEPDYGDLATFDAFLAEAHARGLRVLMDLVPNHCSSDHPWFRAALAASPGSRERARFFFRDGRGSSGDEPPNNWESTFGGPAWTRVIEADGRPGQWYLHLFDSSQPDFDWTNPEVVAHFDDVLRFWFDRGVDGFRIDVAHGLAKHPELADWCLHPDDPSDYNGHAWNRPEVHEVHRRWRKIAESYDPERELTLVGEIWVPTPADLALYLRPDELPQAFYFDLLTQPFNAKAFRTSVDTGMRDIASTGAVITWVLSNHDVHRTVTRYGQEPEVEDHAGSFLPPRRWTPVDVALGTRRARAAILLLLALPGAVYLYQGEELGLPEVLDLPDEARQDPIFRRTQGEDLGRDGCRVPLPWTPDPSTAYGFSPPTRTADPWLPQPQWFADYAAARQEVDPASMLSLYRAALARRSELFAGDLVWDDSLGRDDVLVVRRGAARCVIAFGDESVAVPEDWGAVVVASQPLDGRVLPAASAAWITLDR